MLRPTIFVRSRNAFVAHVARVCRTERVARAQANARATDTPLRSKRPRADAVTYAVVDRVVEAVFNTIHAELKTTGKFTGLRRHGTFEQFAHSGKVEYRPNNAALDRMDEAAAEALAMVGGFDEHWAQQQADLAQQQDEGEEA